MAQTSWRAPGRSDSPRMLRARSSASATVLRGTEVLAQEVRLLLSLIVALVAWPATSSHGHTAIQSPRADIERLIRDSGAEVAVVVRPLDPKPGDPRAISINGTTRFHAASTM